MNRVRKLKDHIEDLSTEAEDQPKPSLGIAQIEVVFNYGKIIKLLKERGTEISQSNWEKVEACNKKIDKYL